MSHSGILGFMTLLPTENENILVFEKSKWIRKQKFTSNIGFFLQFFSQLILATGSQNRSPDITVNYGNWAHAGFVWKNPLRFYPASLIRINPPGKSQKNPLEGGFF